jgi:glyoxylase-like metal-dependent hydrolase (beta-lactamase superfamily II)
MRPIAHVPSRTAILGSLRVEAFPHPQGCRSYLVTESRSGQSMAIDPHLDLVDAVERRVRAEGATLPYVVDTHTHADHPSGAAALASRFASTRIAHPDAGHRGSTRHPSDGESLHLGDVPVEVRHVPGHTPDHLALLVPGAAFTGDALLIGSVGRVDFEGGDAHALFRSLRRLLDGVSGETLVFPGHDYLDRTHSTVGAELAGNPWLRITDPDEFARRLTADPPARPANMDALLAANRAGAPFPAAVSAAEAVERVRAGAATVVDVRSGVEVDAERLPQSLHVPVDEVERRADDVRAAPAPRLLLCRTGRRAESAQEALVRLGVGATQVVEGGLEAYRAAGGATVGGTGRMSLERQVRVVAGLLVVAAVALGSFVHPAFLAVAAFVGAGQVFAGLTDWCGMGLLLAKAPWNRRRIPGTSQPPPPACAAPAAQGVGGCAAPALPLAPRAGPAG